MAPRPGPSDLGALRSAAELVLPLRCGGCDAPGRRLCDACREELADLALPAVPVHPWPPPDGWPGCDAVLRYDGVASRLVRAAKDGDRRDLLPLMARVLAVGVVRGLARLADGRASGGRSEVRLVPVPSSRRSRRARGDAPVTTLVRLAAARAGEDLGGRPVVAELLRARRPVADQAGLGAAERRANLAGAMAVTASRQVSGRRLLVVDDVVTSGSTLAEARAVLLAAGAAEVGLVTLCATPRRSLPK